MFTSIKETLLLLAYASTTSFIRYSFNCWTDTVNGFEIDFDAEEQQFYITDCEGFGRLVTDLEEIWSLIQPEIVYNFINQ